MWTGLRLITAVCLLILYFTIPIKRQWNLLDRFQANDYGDYYCEGSNRLGKSRAKITLYGEKPPAHASFYVNIRVLPIKYPASSN